MIITQGELFKNNKDYKPDKEIQNIIEMLQQNRDRVNEIKMGKEGNDDSINAEIDSVFNTVLDKINIKEIRDKKSFFSSLKSMAEKTVMRKVGNVGNFSDLTDQHWMNDLHRSERYLRDLVEFYKKNEFDMPIPLAAFYYYQIDYLKRDLETHPWGKESVDELFREVFPECTDPYLLIRKAIDKSCWSLFCNESFCRDKEKIKFAVSKSLDEIAAIPVELLSDLQFNQELDNICVDSVKKDFDHFNYIPLYRLKRIPFLMSLLSINPKCAIYYLPTELKFNKEVIKNIYNMGLKVDWEHFGWFIDDSSLLSEEHLCECGISSDDVEIILKGFEDYRNAFDQFQKSGLKN